MDPLANNSVAYITLITLSKMGRWNLYCWKGPSPFSKFFFLSMAVAGDGKYIPAAMAWTLTS